MYRPAATESLGEILRVLREQTGRSLHTLSTACGVAYHTLRRLEAGEINKPSLDDLAALARVYGLDLNQLGALAGVWTVEEQEQELLDLELHQALRDLRDLAASRLSAAQQRDLADILCGIHWAWQRKLSPPSAAEPGLPDDPRLPKWLRRQPAPARPRGA